MKEIIVLGTAAFAAAPMTDAAAKARSQATITIHAPIEAVWGLVVDIDNWPRWNKAVAKAQLHGSFAKGSSFTWRSGGFGIRSTLQEIAPLQRLSWTGRTLGTKAVHSWTFANTEDGVVVITTETFSGWLPAIMPKTMQKTLDTALPALLASLKQAAESQSL